MLDYSKLSSKISNTEQNQVTNEPKQEDYISYLQSKKKEKTSSSLPSNTKPKKEVKKQSFVDKLLPDKELEKGRKAVLDVFSPKTVKGAIKEIAKAPELLKKANERFGQSLRRATGTVILEDLKNKDIATYRARSGIKNFKEIPLGADTASQFGLKEKTSTGSKKIDQALDQSAFVASLAAPLPGAEAMTFASGASKVGTAFKKGKIPTTTVKKPLLSLPSKQFEVQQALKNQPLALPSKQQQFIDKVASQGAKSDKGIKLSGQGTKALPEAPPEQLTLTEGRGLLPATKAIRVKAEQKVNPYLQKFETLVETARSQGLQDKPGRYFENWNSLYSQIAKPEDPSLMELVNLAFPDKKGRSSQSILKGLQNARTMENNRAMWGLQRNPFAKTVAERTPAPEVLGKPAMPQTQVQVTGKIPSVVKMEQPRNAPYSTVNAQNVPFDRSPLPSTPIREPLTPQNMAGMREAIPQPQNRVELRGQLPESPIPRPQKVINAEFTPVVEKPLQKGGTSISEITSIKNAITNAEKELIKANESKNRLIQTISSKGENPNRLAKLNQIEESIVEYKNQLNLSQKALNELDTRNINIQPNEYTRENVKNLVEEIVKNDDLGKLNENIKTVTSGFKKGYYGITDIFRVVNKKIGKDSQLVRNVLDNFDDDKGRMADFVTSELDDLSTTIIKKLGIEKSTKLSAAVQDFGEKVLSEEELVKQFPKDAQKIKEAAAWFRAKYDQYIDAVNEQIAMIYGGVEKAKKAGKLVTKRDDYFHHFEELSGTGRFQQFIESLMSKVAGKTISQFAKPNIKKAGYMMKRLGGSYTSDAVGGFLKYLPEAAYTMYIDKYAQVFRQLGAQIEKQTDKAPFLVSYFKRFGDELVGIPTGLDKGLSDEVSQKALSLLQRATNRTKTNAILGNFASVLAQPGMLPNIIAENGIGNTLKGLKRVVSGNSIAKEVPFYKERYLDQKFREFDTKLLEQPKKFFSWLLESADKATAEIMINGAYEKAISKKSEDALRETGKSARNILGGRGVGEQSPWQKQVWFQTVAPFSLEPIVDLRTKLGYLTDKQFGKLITTLAVGYGINEFMYQTRGNRISSDFVNAVKEASAPGLSTPQRVGRIAGEALSSIPSGANIADILIPETGIKWKGETLSRKELFGQQDPTRFGTSSILVKPFVDASKALWKGDIYNATLGMLTTFATPYGGAQIRKTLEGAETISKGGRFKNDKLYYPVERTPSNIAKSLLFGSSTTKEGKAFYNAPGVPRPLTKKETQKALSSNDLKSSYNQIKTRNKINGLKDEKVNVRKGLGKYSNYTENQKKLEYARINKDIEKLQAEEKSYIK